MENISTDIKTDVKTGRIKAVDRFRGFCVFAMLIFQFLKNFNLGWLSRLANHSLDKGIVILPGMTLADIIAPMFIFAIGLTFALSFNKWAKAYGKKSAYVRYALRGLSIIGLGGILATCNTMLDYFGGDKLNTVDLIFLALSIIAIVAFVVKLICQIPKNDKLRKITTFIAYIAVSLIGVTTLIVACADFFTLLHDINAPYNGYWVTLQNIGMAYLIGLIVVDAKNWVRLLVAGSIFVLYSIFHQIGNHQAMLDVVVHGGFLGGFGWGAMLIFDMVLADVFFKDKLKYLTLSSLFMAIGVWSTCFFGNINLGSCSPAFVLVGVGLSGVVFYLFYLLDKLPYGKFDPLCWWGKNPIVMFLIEFFVLGLYGELMPESILGGAPWWLASIQGIVALVALTAVAYLLYRRKKSISL